jgi:hypothetical protein
MDIDATDGAIPGDAAKGLIPGTPGRANCCSACMCACCCCRVQCCIAESVQPSRNGRLWHTAHSSAVMPTNLTRTCAPIAAARLLEIQLGPRVLPFGSPRYCTCCSWIWRSICCCCWYAVRSAAWSTLNSGSRPSGCVASHARTSVWEAGGPPANGSKRVALVHTISNGESEHRVDAQR